MAFVPQPENSLIVLTTPLTLSQDQLGRPSKKSLFHSPLSLGLSMYQRRSSSRKEVQMPNEISSLSFCWAADKIPETVEEFVVGTKAWSKFP